MLGMPVSEFIDDLKRPIVSEPSLRVLDAILRIIGSEMRICRWCDRPFAVKRPDQFYCPPPARCACYDWNKRRRLPLRTSSET